MIEMNNNLTATREVKYLEERVEDLEKETSLQKEEIQDLKKEISELRNKLSVKKLGIVGFSYEITNHDSQQPWITKRQIGRITSDKIRIAYGWNWSEEYQDGYGYSHAYLSDQGPFYNIDGGYTDYNREGGSHRNKIWGTQNGTDFLIKEGKCWDYRFGADTYSYTHIFLSENQISSNIVGIRARQTTKDSSSFWVQTDLYGKKTFNEVDWANGFGWNEFCSVPGNAYFSFYLE